MSLNTCERDDTHTHSLERWWSVRQRQKCVVIARIQSPKSGESQGIYIEIAKWLRTLFACFFSVHPSRFWPLLNRSRFLCPRQQQQKKREGTQQHPSEPRKVNPLIYQKNNHTRVHNRCTHIHTTNEWNNFFSARCWNRSKYDFWYCWMLWFCCFSLILFCASAYFVVAIRVLQDSSHAYTYATCECAFVAARCVHFVWVWRSMALAICERAFFVVFLLSFCFYILVS